MVILWSFYGHFMVILWSFYGHFMVILQQAIYGVKSAIHFLRVRPQLKPDVAQ
jgi:hypothetical protein